jgi:outer membrane lipoprotein
MVRTPSILAATIMIAAALGGCATPFDVGTADRKTTPQQATADIDAVRGRTVAWGGVIVNAKNLQNATQVEVLGYPLDLDNRPDTKAAPLGRFLALHQGYLETADYNAGRHVTVVGSVTETREGTVGEARYVYPVLATTRVHLWPKETQRSSDPQIHFGIGIGIQR